MIKLYLLSILLVLLPPFVLFGNSLFGTHSIAKIIWVGLFFSQLIFRKKQLFESLFSNKIVLLSFLFFISQSISYLFSIDKVAFFYAYEDFFFGYVFFLTILSLEDSKFSSKLFIIISIGLLFNTLTNCFLLFYPETFFKIFSHLFNLNYLEIVRQEYERNRLGMENFDFILLPLFIYFPLQFYKNVFFSYFCFLTNGYLLLMSNFRTKVILFIISILSVLIIFRKKSIALMVLFVVLLGLATFQLRIGSYQVNLTKRYTNKQINLASVEIRSRIWKESLKIAKENYMGVGLGNFQHYIQRDNRSQSGNIKSYTAAIYLDPHNRLIKLLVETGIVGFLTFLIMILYMAYLDFHILFKCNNLTKVYFICFWSLVVFSLYNPSEIIKYQMLFWFLRAKIILQKNNYRKCVIPD